MNYFAHAFDFLSRDPDPYLVAGLAVPDWLNVVHRRVKTRSRAAQAFMASEKSDSNENALARGIVQHHADDHWFHEGVAFNSLCLNFAVELRDLLAPDRGFRPSFLGHILVELLLDDFLNRSFPGRLDQYYGLLDELDEHIVAKTVARISGQNVDQLHWLIDRFRKIRFLYDYSSDEKLLRRLNQVMQRVKLLPLPDKLIDFFGPARERVAQQADQLYFEPRKQNPIPGAENESIRDTDSPQE